jgi:hypothetical protein
MSWTKITLTPDQVHRLHKLHVPDLEDWQASLRFLEFEEWLKDWCKLNCKDRVKIRIRMGPVEEDGLVARIQRLRKAQTIKAMYVKFKSADDAMIFRLTL